MNYDHFLLILQNFYQQKTSLADWVNQSPFATTVNGSVSLAYVCMIEKWSKVLGKQIIDNIC